jgi:hypothetical protein
MIQPVGVKPKTTAYRWFYSMSKPMLPALRALLPDQVLSTPHVRPGDAEDSQQWRPEAGAGKRRHQCAEQARDAAVSRRY